MKNSIIFFTLLGCIAFQFRSEAQNYNSAIGARLGYPLSLSYKKFIGESSAFELLAGTHGRRYTYSFGDYGWRWFMVGGAYQKHQPLNLDADGLENLQWYWGGGATAYFWTFDDYYADRYASTSFGIQGYIGLDYAFDEIPLNITLDWVPTIFLNGFGSGFGAGYGSVGVRYVLN